MGRAADVVVVGGGPAGSICAAFLARRGLAVTLLEKTRFPRFRLGESLLPQSLVLLEEVGVLPAVDASFIRKYGARFHDDIRNRKERFSFDGAWNAARDHAYQVPRDAFDALLLEHARSCGVDVREEARVDRIVTGDRGRAVGVSAIFPGGATTNGRAETVGARFVVDASGRDALTAHAARATQTIDGLDQTAFYAHFEGVRRAEGKLAGDIDIVLFPSGDPDGRVANWFWVIPFKDGRTSVGAVVSKRSIGERRAALPHDAHVPTALFEAAVAESEAATSLLADARRLWPQAEAAADFSYRVASMSGDGWMAVGDAGGFIDPLFSTGVHIAMSGARLAADAIVASLERPADERSLAEAWEARVRAGAETFILAVRAFYRGPLVDTLFMDNKHTALRRSITSLLAGDVFGDAVWLRDTRLRLKAMVNDQVSF